MLQWLEVMDGGSLTNTTIDLQMPTTTMIVTCNCLQGFSPGVPPQQQLDLDCHYIVADAKCVAWWFDEQSSCSVGTAVQVVDDITALSELLGEKRRCDRSLYGFGNEVEKDYFERGVKIKYICFGISVCITD